MLKAWEGIKFLVDINKRNNKTVTSLNVDGIEEMDPFSQVFSTISQKGEGKISKTNKHFSFRYSNRSSTIKIFSHTTLSDEIQEIIKSLNDKKAIGPNSILTKVLKKFGKTISISSFGKPY